MNQDIDLALCARFDAEQRLREIDLKLQGNADEFLIKAMLAAVNGRSPEEIDEYYRRSIQSWASERNVRAYANFLTRRGRHAEARPLYERLEKEFAGMSAVLSAILARGGAA